MRIPLAINPAAEQRVPSGPMEFPREAVSAAEWDARQGFADALLGLVGAGGQAGFDLAADVPPVVDGKTMDTPAADSGAAGEPPVTPALDMPLAMPVPIPMLPAQPVATTPPPLAIAAAPGMPLPAVAAAADQDVRLARTAPTSPASPATSPAAPAVPAGMVQRMADAAGTAVPPPALPADSSRPGPVQAAGAEVSLPKPKAANGAVPEHRPATATAPEAAVPASAVLASSPPSESAAADTAPAVKLPAGTPDQWRRPLMEALGDRIRVEVGKHSEQAVIRLDPPMLGSVEIAIRHQGGVLQVQLTASHDEVVRQLQNIGDSLRQDLTQRQYTDVSVQVSAHSRDGDGRQRPDAQPEDRQPGRALAEAEAEQTPSVFALSSERD